MPSNTAGPSALNVIGKLFCKLKFTDAIPITSFDPLIIALPEARYNDTDLNPISEVIVNDEFVTW
jgi:hypothetical protein